MLFRNIPFALLLLLLTPTVHAGELTKLKQLSKRNNWSFLCFAFPSSICYVADGQVQTIKIKGDYIYHPMIASLSPDSKKMAFIQKSNLSIAGNLRNEIVIFDLVNKTIEKSIQFPGEIREVKWNPNFQEIQFLGKKPGEQFKLFSLETSNFQIVEPPAQSLLTAHSFRSISQNKKTIVLGAPSPSTVESKHETVSVQQGYAVIQLEDGAYPSWSPDENRIAYLDLEGTTCFEINSTGSGKHILFTAKRLFTTSQELIGPIVWSPDSKNIIVHKTKGMKGDDRIIWLFNLETKSKQKIHSGSFFEIVDWKNL
ncbi:MAG: hypothetical protein K1Y36_28050 [Blastocatellia bacterium]|nr:hypothetical protein [Blastocatellia bacterium]